MKGMRCDMCGSTDHDVVDTRPAPNKIRRRRECKECRYRFTTIETVVPGRIKINVRRMKEMREGQGMTLKQIASIFGVSISTISNKLNGIDFYGNNPDL